MASNEHEGSHGSQTPVTGQVQAVDVRDQQSEFNIGGQIGNANIGTHQHTRNETIHAQQANFHVGTLNVANMVNETSQTVGNTVEQLFSDVIQLSDTIRMFNSRKLSRSPTSSIFYGQKTSRVIDPENLAIKLLPLTDKNKVEAQILTRLKPHDHVVSIIHSDLCLQGPIPYLYIAMELCHTQNLHDHILENKRRNVPFDSRLSISQANQIIKGLDYIHGKCIIHRDLKPHNVLMSHDKSVLKIADFGISKPMTNGCSITNVTNAQAGTDGYRAPETYNTNQISLSADIFSLGLVIYFVWSYGYHPYGHEVDLWNYSIKTNRNRNLHDLCVPDVETVKGLLEWMLRFNQTERPSTQQILNHEYFAGLETRPKNVFYPPSSASTSGASASGIRHNHSFPASHQENSQNGVERSHTMHHASTYPIMPSPQPSRINLPPPPQNPRSSQRTWPRTGSKASNLIEFKEAVNPDIPWYQEQQGTWPRSRKSTSSRDPVEHQDGSNRSWLAQQQQGAYGIQQPFYSQDTPNIMQSTFHERGLVQHAQSFQPLNSLRQRQQQPMRNPGQQSGRPPNYGRNLSSAAPLNIHPTSQENPTPCCPANAIIVFDRQTSLLQAKNVNNSTWKSMQSFSEDLKKQHFSAVLLDKSVIVLLWNRQVYQLSYINTNASWCPMRKMKYDHGMPPPADVLNGSIYVAGATGHEKLGCRSVEKYNVIQAKWKTVEQMKTSRTDHSILAAGGCLYAIGGWNYGTLACIERFDPNVGKWSQLTPMKYPRSNPAVAEMEGKLFVLGGSYGIGAETTSNYDIKLSHVERYDIDTEQWTEIRPMTISRSKFKACAVQRKIFAIGGDKGGYRAEDSTVEVYDPQKDEWKTDETWSGMKINCMTPLAAHVRF